MLKPIVSIIIKALNEERHIAATIESALAALAGIDGEVILADAASTDRTVEIAGLYPIQIVRLSRIEDRSCGAGAQLGYQYSRGEYLCLIDGDMRLHCGFIQAAGQFLRDNPAVGGVGGAIIDCDLSNLEFAQRAKRRDPDREPGPVSRLHCSGLYRRSAIVSIGYLTDRNLHAGEELDLGARLHSRGWLLARIDCPAVDHYCHGGSAWRLLLRRFVTRYSWGTGEVLRAACGQSHFWFIVRNDKNVHVCAFVALWWMAVAASGLALTGLNAVIAIGMLVTLPIATMSLRWGSIRHGLYSVAAWNVYAWSFLPGFARSRVSPTRWIDSTVVKHALLATRAGAEPLQVQALPADGSCDFSAPGERTQPA
jgi:glycosyltransferase involved in cell wall biosynthesis